MNEYKIFENSFIDAEPDVLFQKPPFFHMHAQSGATYFELFHSGKIQANIHFTPIDEVGTWRSPARGTYAGLSFVNNMKLRELFAFFEGVQTALRSKGAKFLEVLLAPQSHDPVAFAKQVFLLRSFGFETTKCDLNHSLEIDSRSLSERMTYGNLKRLRKCDRENLVAMHLSHSSLSKVYETLAINRASKGNSMSMTLKQLQLMADTFPEDVILFGCPDGEHYAAAAICLRLSSSVLYVFYWGDRPEYANKSPVVALADTIYRYGRDQGFRIIDVGTSTIDRQANFGLIEFKSGLGFSESLKITMRKIL